MSDYSQITFFAPKDALPSGNPSKLIKGTEIDPELSAISTAIGSKFDSADIATGPEAVALASDAKILTPAKLLAALVGGDFSTGVGLITSLAADASPDQAADYLLSFDASAGVLKKVTPAAIASAVGVVPTSRLISAGAGLSGGGSLAADRTLSLDTGSARNSDHSAISITAGAGLTGGGTIEATRSVALDYETGTYTASFTGFGIAVNSTVRYTRQYKMVTLFIGHATGVSNSTSFGETSGNMPASIRPARTQQCAAHGTDLGSGTMCTVSVHTNGNMTLEKWSGSGAWSNSGTKAIGVTSGGVTITYSLD